ncbi:MAG: hypothetical protein U0795_20995 [Pirellulales bacterium]
MLAWSAGPLLVAGIALAIVVLVGPPAYNRAWDVTWDTGHVLIFGVISAALALALRMWGLRPSFAYGIAAAASIGVGGLLEIIQRGIAHRSAEWIDFINDVLGTAAALLIVITFDRAVRLGPWQRRWCRWGAVALVAVSLLPMVSIWNDYRIRTRIWPTLLVAAEPSSLRFVRWPGCEVSRTTPPPGWPTQAETPADRVFRIEFVWGDWPQFSLFEPVADWSQFDAVELPLWLAGDRPEQVELRIDDAHHNYQYDDRFNRSLMLQPGWQTVRVRLADVEHGPRHRLLDLRQVAYVSLYLNHPTRPVVLYTDRWRLIPIGQQPPDVAPPGSEASASVN